MSEPYSFSLVCDEFDQFNELAKDWDVDFRALSSSPLTTFNFSSRTQGKLKFPSLILV